MTSHLLSNILMVSEGIAALVGLVYFFRLKNSYWKWFSVYLIFIFMQEMFWKYHPDSKLLGEVSKADYFKYFGISIEFLFFFWLYAWKSLLNKKLFWVFSAIYLLMLWMDKISDNVAVTNPISYTLGVLFLFILVILEFVKQIRSDDILDFYQNKMFYINLAIIIGYLSNYPFWAFFKDLFENYYDIWNFYYRFFLVTMSMAYILFAASFIWGKNNS